MTRVRQIRAVHLFSDRKFIPWAAATFDREGWRSHYVVLDRQAGAVTTAHQGGIGITLVPQSPAGMAWILDNLREADLVFHYLMDNVKAEIIARSDAPVRHYWCFYGAEIYQQTPLFRDVLYGPATRKWLHLLPEIRFRYLMRKGYYRWIRREPAPLDSLRRAVPRIAGILWYVEDEIAWIRERMALPPYVFFQFFRFEDIIPDETVQCDRTAQNILVGNSATVENNHADVLDVLRTLPADTHHYTLPVTYGQFARYKSMLMRRGQRVLGSRVRFLDQHMPLGEYYALLHQHPTAIFLHRRQQALGNIFYLLYAGAKVYLSRHNIIYTWLQHHDVNVFSFEDCFAEDHRRGQLTLTDAEAGHNREAIRRLLRHDRNEAFFNQLESSIGHDD
jgi:hypothetical protein